MEVLPLKIGNITFDAPFEGPNGWEEGLGDLGSEMKMSVTEFPGGIVTAQLLGSFPKEIPISGKLFGAYARSRSFEFQKLVDAGELVELSYAEWSFMGVAKDYQPHVKGPNEIWFKLIFKPLLNNSSGTGPALAPPITDVFAGTVANAVNTMQQQSTSPANGSSLPANVQQGAASLKQTITNQLQANGGNLSTLTPSAVNAIRGQISTLVATLSPMTNGSDPVLAGAAADLSSTLFILNVAFNKTAASGQRLDTVSQFNPDLYMMAAFYYGNPSKWQLIADATNAEKLDQPLIADPQPVGNYTLIIPVDTTFTLSSPATVMTDDLAKTS